MRDHGPGVPPAQKNEVFRQFYRADKSRSDRGHFGLGLAIAAQLALAQKGHLSLADTPGGGATFTLVLPVWRPGKGDEGPPPPA